VDSHAENLNCQQGTETMARNFGMPRQIRREYRGSLWPILLIVFVLAGAIDIAAHLNHW